VISQVEIDEMTDLSMKFSGFRYQLKDLWEAYKEGRKPVRALARETATRIEERLLPEADEQGAKELQVIINLLRHAVYSVREYDRVMKKILG
jgi:hypothetical protein